MTRRVLKPSNVCVPDENYSAGIQYKDWVFASAQMATDYKSGLASEVRGNIAVPLAGEGLHMREAGHILKNLQSILAEAGTDLASGVRLDQFPVNREVMDPYQAMRGTFISAPRPSSQSVHIDALPVPDANISVDMIAVIQSDRQKIEAINTDKVPSPLGLFTQASKFGDYVFPAGQLATDWRTGLAPEVRGTAFHWGNNQIERETRYVLKNIGLTLEAAGSSLQNVVKATVYLTDINDLPRVDRVWREVFPTDPPARTVFPVHSLGVKETTIEINVVAVADDGAAKKEVVYTERARRSPFHQSQAIRAGDFLFISGLMAGDGDGLTPEARVNPHHPYAIDGAAAQMIAILEDAAAICEEAGVRIEDAVRMTEIHTNLANHVSARSIYDGVFAAGRPASSLFQVPGPLPIPGCAILLDLWIATSV